jgi:hypothetical protein
MNQIVMKRTEHRQVRGIIRATFTHRKNMMDMNPTIRAACFPVEPLMGTPSAVASKHRMFLLRR